MYTYMAPTCPIPAGIVAPTAALCGVSRASDASPRLQNPRGCALLPEDDKHRRQPQRDLLCRPRAFWQWRGLVSLPAGTGVSFGIARRSFPVPCVGADSTPPSQLGPGIGCRQHNGPLSPTGRTRLAARCLIFLENSVLKNLGRRSGSTRGECFPVCCRRRIPAAVFLSESR